MRWATKPKLRLTSSSLIAFGHPSDTGREDLVRGRRRGGPCLEPGEERRAGGMPAKLSNPVVPVADRGARRVEMHAERGLVAVVPLLLSRAREPYRARHGHAAGNSSLRRVITSRPARRKTAQL